jgi:hypothetical protein
MEVLVCSGAFVVTGEFRIRGDGGRILNAGYSFRGDA